MTTINELYTATYEQYTSLKDTLHQAALDIGEVKGQYMFLKVRVETAQRNTCDPRITKVKKTAEHMSKQFEYIKQAHDKGNALASSLEQAITDYSQGMENAQTVLSLAERLPKAQKEANKVLEHAATELATLQTALKTVQVYNTHLAKRIPDTQRDITRYELLKERAPTYTYELAGDISFEGENIKSVTKQCEQKRTNGEFHKKLENAVTTIEKIKEGCELHLLLEDLDKSKLTTYQNDLNEMKRIVDAGKDVEHFFRSAIAHFQHDKSADTKKRINELRDFHGVIQARLTHLQTRLPKAEAALSSYKAAFPKVENSITGEAVSKEQSPASWFSWGT